MFLHWYLIIFENDILIHGFNFKLSGMQIQTEHFSFQNLVLNHKKLFTVIWYLVFYIGYGNYMIYIIAVDINYLYTLNVCQ